MPDLKSVLIEKIQNCQDENFLQEVFEIIAQHENANKKDWWDELSHDQRNHVEEAIEQYKTGKVITNEEMKKKLAAWRNR